LGAGVALAAVVAEADAHRPRRRARQLQRPPAEALRPEVLRLLALAEDRPVTHDGLPGLAAVGRGLALVLDGGVGRGAAKGAGAQRGRAPPGAPPLPGSPGGGEGPPRGGARAPAPGRAGRPPAPAPTPRSAPSCRRPSAAACPRRWPGRRS